MSWAGYSPRCGRRVGYDFVTKPQYSNCIHIYICTGLPQCLSSEERACNTADVCSIPGLGSYGGGHSNPFQYSCLENPMEEEPGGLQSIGVQRVGHNETTELAYTHAHITVYCSCLFAKSYPTHVTPVDCSPPDSSVHGFLRQAYWSGLPFPSLGDPPNPRIEPRYHIYIFCIGRQILYHQATREAPYICVCIHKGYYE